MSIFKVKMRIIISPFTYVHFAYHYEFSETVMVTVSNGPTMSWRWNSTERFGSTATHSMASRPAKRLVVAKLLMGSDQSECTDWKDIIKLNYELNWTRSRIRDKTAFHSHSHRTARRHWICKTNNKWGKKRKMKMRIKSSWFQSSENENVLVQDFTLHSM